MKPIVWLVLLALPCLAATAEQRAREERLENSLLAPCCYAEPVARHGSDAAVRMRAEIARMVEANQPDSEIVSYYQQRYGAKIYSPPKQTAGWVYVVPWAVLLGGMGLIFRWLRIQYCCKGVQPKQGES